MLTAVKVIRSLATIGITAALAMVLLSIACNQFIIVMSVLGYR